MALITATDVSVCPGVSQDPVLVIVSSSGVIHAYNFSSSLWKPLSMATT